MDAQHIGHYPVTGVVGSGGFGTVHRGTDPGTGETVAIKVLNWPQDDVRRQMFRAEIAALRAVDHPNVVRVRDVIDTPDLAAIVTDFVEGASLRQVLRQAGLLDGRQALGVLHGALQGLAAVHAVGLVHADLKPDNILIDPSGTSRLIDFGLAGPPRALAGPGTWSGTPSYISPEQVAGDHVDARSDIYAAGVVLFELLCGRPPYRGETADLTAMLHLTAPVPDPRRLVPDLGDDLAGICQQDLDKDPAVRHQNATAFLTSLDHAARQKYGPAWLAGAGLGTVIGGVIAALPAGAGMLGSAGVVGSAATAVMGGVGGAA
ncbi:serine/threonine-protein kinase, partial [Nocardioides jensenii]|uniref:serine/threonine-protein kinase n=1 Tax=Nocardioides jensenii TaxID=1843 RepID=UPI000A65D1AE